MMIFKYLLAAMGGSAVTVIVMAMCAVAGQDDEAIYADEKSHSGLLEEED